ncbi:MAG TPA: carboxypeptidase regulatory-like domain-containing protein [Bryobacteraceae bacterium]|nr:carboxypeptidase regulatory-like domain-containing protein [Bryobacteraceae bacterium]
MRRLLHAKPIPVAVIAFLALRFAGALFAQAGATSQISGVVRDPSGSAVPEAQVKATQTDTGIVRATQTGVDGAYVLPNLPIGPYRLEVSKQGFNTAAQQFTLQVATSPTVDVTLQVGAATQEVVVEAAAAGVETTTSGVGQVIDQRRVVDLPLNGRNPTELIYLAGAAAQAPNADLVSTKAYTSEVPISIGGGLANGALYQLDGGSHNDPSNNLALPLPFPDAMQEFNVQTSALPAQYGQHSAGVVNVVTKSGTNDFHGDVFEFLRNGDLNARNFFAASRDSLKRNQYGGTIGGPIRKDKLFFFAGYQGTDIRSDPTSSFTFIPTQQMLNGDFSTFASAQCQGSNKTLTNPVPGGPQFVNNQISPTAFNPAAVKMMSFYTLPASACGQTYFGIKQNSDEAMGVAKVDYQINAKQSLFLRYFATHLTLQTPFDGKNPLTETLSGADDLVNSGVLGYTWLISPNTINSFRATANRAGITKTQIPSFDASTLGINMTAQVPGHIVVSATGGIYSSTVFSYAATDPTTSFQTGDDLSLIRGPHQIQVGVNWMYSYENIYGPLFGDGSFSFNGQYSGLPLADFLLGYSSSFTQAGPQDARDRYTYFGGYAQDSWKVTPRLTINYGLRWEPYIGNTMPNARVGHFDLGLFEQNAHSSVYPNAPAGYEFPGDPGFDTSKRPAHTKLDDFAPRFGLAWDPTGRGKMSIRASWGIFYDLPQTLFAYGFSEEPPWSSTIGIPGGKTSPVLFNNPWASNGGVNPFPLSLGANAIFPLAATYTTYPLNLKVTYLEQWNLSIQKQFGNWVIAANYLGNNTMHLWSDDPINAPVPPGISTSASVQSRRPLTLLNPAQGAYYGTIHDLDYGGTASYEALLLSAQHYFSKNFSVLGNYTYSHCITDPFTSELDGTQWSDPLSRRFDRGNCVQIDHRQIVNVSAVLRSPGLGAGFANALSRNWQISPIMMISSGAFFSVSSGTDNANIGLSGVERAQQILPNPYCHPQTVTCWLNPAAFGGPASGTLGNSGAGSVEGPASFTFDMALVRDFKLKEHYGVEARGEVFNLPNTFRPGFPPLGVSTTMLSTSRTASNFGQIQIANDPRIMQLAMKFTF